MKIVYDELSNQYVLFISYIFSPIRITRITIPTLEIIEYSDHNVLLEILL